MTTVPFAVKFWCLGGFLLATYASYVELMHYMYPGEYKAMCDFDEGASCSRVLTSDYSNIFFGVPNSVMGMLFYPAIWMLFAFDLKFLAKAAIVFSCIGSLCLAYVLFFVLEDLCIVCTGIYLCNFGLLFSAFCIGERKQKTALL